MKVPFMSLKTLDQKEREIYHCVLDRFLDHGQYLNGSELTDFEDKFAKKVGMKYCSGVSSGTDSLYLALKVLGIKEGDEVIVPALSWYSTALAVSCVGAKPIFADIKNDLTICPSSVERLISTRSKAIIPVHYMGNSCDMTALQSFGIDIIEDCSQAFGTTYNGEMVGSFGQINCFSLNPMKPLGAMGDAGAIVTDNSDYDEKVKTLRYCGMKDKNTHVQESLNFRMDSFQAAILNERLRLFSRKVTRLKKVYSMYLQRLRGIVKIVDLQPNAIPYGLTLVVDNREELQQALSGYGIETKVQHDPLMCDLNIYLKQYHDVSNAKRIVKKIVNLPFYESLTEYEINYVCDKIEGFYE